MKTIMLLMSLFVTTVLSAQKSFPIETEDGKMLVQYDARGNQFIDFEPTLWQDIFNQKDIDIKSLPKGGIRICIRIATIKSDCLTGIGFRCKNCDNELVISASIETKEKNVVTGSYEYLPKVGKVRLTFDRLVDWQAMSKK
jgi:hypothetical protein